MRVVCKPLVEPANSDALVKASSIMGEIGNLAVWESLSPAERRQLPPGSRNTDSNTPIIAVQYDKSFWHIICNFPDEEGTRELVAKEAIEKAIQDRVFGIDDEGKVFYTRPLERRTFRLQNYDDRHDVLGGAVPYDSAPLRMLVADEPLDQLGIGEGTRATHNREYSKEDVFFVIRET